MQKHTQTPKAQDKVQLKITRHDALEHEKIHKNGVQKNVHAVIKNNPFQFELATNSSNFNFNKVGGIEAKLLYDTNDGEEKAVNFVKCSPMEYSCRISPKGDSIIVDMKLAVLSSQHEDMCFCVKFNIKGTEQSVVSEPIRVVSKPAQLKKNRDSMRRGTKRTFNDTLKDTLARIESAQRDHQALLSSLFQTVTHNQIPPTAQTKTQASTQPPSKKVKRSESPDSASESDVEPTITIPKSKAQAFEAHLLGLIDAYHDIPLEERAEIVRKVVRTSPASTTDRLSEVVDCLLLEGLKREIGMNIETGSPYAGLMDFGNAEQTELESFCTDFLAPLIEQQEETSYHCSKVAPYRLRALLLAQQINKLRSANKDGSEGGRGPYKDLAAV